MVRSEKQPMLVHFVVGTTAVGKSAWSLKWAEQTSGCIINADSVQVYEKVDIGTAKPSKSELDLVPHYLFDFVKPMNSYTAGDYREDTLRVLGDLNKHDYPGGIFITGGSGFYLKALENGMFPTDEVSADVKDQIKSWEARSHSLHKELSSLDPEHAKKISENDGYRVRRSLGLVLTHKTTMLKIQQQFEQQKTPFPYAIKKIGLSIHRDELRKRVQSRVDKMLELGLIDEVKGHLDSGLREWSPLKSVGYKEVVNYLDDLWDLKEMKERLVINTMQLAKRQRTWFQKDKSIQWYDVLKDKSELEEVCK